MACRSFGAFYAFTALIDAGALAHGNRENENILLRGPDEPWLGVQLLGSIRRDIELSAEMLDNMNYESVDFNMGCPMQKVIKRPAGAALLYPENHNLAFDCVRWIRSRTNRPFTVKLRILDAENPQPTVDFCRRLQDLGVEGITIHGRIAKMIYSGPVACNVIRAVREALDIPITANGGVYSLEDAQSLAEKTGCDRIMVARGTLGAPWLFKELADGAKYVPKHLELCDTMERQVKGMIALYGEEAACILSRKIISAYTRGRGYSKEYRIRAGQIGTLAEFEGFLNDLRKSGPVSKTNALDFDGFETIV